MMQSSHTGKFQKLVVPRPLQPVDTPLGILTASEWKSFAFLQYCQADGFSVSALLNVVLEDDLEDDSFGIDADLWRTS